MSFKLSLKAFSLDAKVFEDNNEIEDCYYDPFENNEEIIRSVMFV